MRLRGRLSRGGIEGQEKELRVWGVQGGGGWGQNQGEDTDLDTQKAEGGGERNAGQQ